MANLTPGENFTDPSITTAKLNSLVDDAGLINLAPADLTSGAGYFLMTAAASPAEGDIHIDTTTGLFKHYDGSSQLFDRTEPFEIPLTNNSGTAMTAGDVVYGDPANDDGFIMADGVVQTMNVVGVLKANTADSASGQVYVRGEADVLVAGGAQGSPAGGWLTPVSTVGSTTAIGILASNPSFDTFRGVTYFGMLLEAVPAGTTTLAKALLWR
jgi:hypothetical protein